ncbi:GNAT family N-acetyltransferase [Phytohalomonas tamaricis]|uniref:GNAT family N-acetyltransferase n=1 Tax=Phytohalomonas tamaricis TaxID=2081032 RepID=UPI000D0B8F1E|nr:GNAT family N-acetyltransferase [Phytohalomonas tamaricis]
MAIILPVTQPDDHLLDELIELLIDSVHGGASMGFMAPLSEFEANTYWQGVFKLMGPQHRLWIAREGERVLGAVQLALCLKANGTHRAEVMKLCVHSEARGRGFASELMATLEAFARMEGRTLLTLDTRASSPAEQIYGHLGWLKSGEIPGYAFDPDGAGPHATAIYYKRLG